MESSKQGRLVIPTITEDDLRPFAEQSLAFAAAMYREAKKHAESPAEVVQIFSASLAECVDRVRRMANEHSEDESSAEQARVHKNMHTLVQTICSASMGLLPIMAGLERKWAVLAAKEESKLN